MKTELINVPCCVAPSLDPARVCVTVFIAIAVMCLASCSPNAEPTDSSNEAETNEAETSPELSELETPAEPAVATPAELAVDVYVAARLSLKPIKQ